MAGGTKPVFQPLYWLLNKIFKGNLCGLCNHLMITASINHKTGHPIPISRQFYLQCMVISWGGIPDALVSKAWTVCVKKALESDPSTDLVLRSRIMVLTIMAGP